MSFFAQIETSTRPTMTKLTPAIKKYLNSTTFFKNNYQSQMKRVKNTKGIKNPP
jgi:hypothetical protein